MLSSPVLYLSRAIIRTKTDYYRLLLEVTSRDAWEPWVLYMLEAVAETAGWALGKVRAIAKRQTASDYLTRLAEIGVLTPMQSGREKLFIHRRTMGR